MPWLTLAFGPLLESKSLSTYTLRDCPLQATVKVDIMSYFRSLARNVPESSTSPLSRTTSLLHKTAKVLLVVLLAYLFSLLCVHLSERKGRLESVPTYDDVVYILTGLDLARSIQDHGIAGWSDHYQRYGSHGPFPELQAALTIYLVGFSVRQIYVSNFLLISIFLFFLLYFFSSLKTGVQFLLLGCFLCLPFAIMTVVEFRPDMAWAIFLGFATVYIVTRRDFFLTILPSVAFGLLAGLAFLGKPSTFPMTGLTLGLAVLGRLVLEFYRPERPVVSKLFLRLAGRCLIMLATGSVVTGLYLYYFGRQILNYFRDNIFGTSRVIFDYFSHYPWNFYLWGKGFQSNIGLSGLILIVAALAVLAFARRLSVYERTELEVCGILMLTAYAINAHAPVASPFLAGALYGTLIFTMAYVLGRYFLNTNARTEIDRQTQSAQEGRQIISFNRSSGWLPAALFLACLVFCHWPTYSKVAGSGRYLRAVHENLYSYLEQIPFPSRICLTQASPTIRENIIIWYLLHSHRAPEILSVASVISFDEGWTMVEGCNVIIAQDSGLKGTIAWLPCEKWQDQIVNRLKNSPDYRLVRSWPDSHGKNLYVFQRDKPPTP